MVTLKEERFAEMLRKAQAERQELSIVLGQNVGAYGLVTNVSEGLVTMETTFEASMVNTVRVHHIAISDIIKITYDLQIKRLG